MLLFKIRYKEIVFLIIYFSLVKKKNLVVWQTKVQNGEHHLYACTSNGFLDVKEVQKGGGLYTSSVLQNESEFLTRKNKTSDYSFIEFSLLVSKFH